MSERPGTDPNTVNKLPLFDPTEAAARRRADNWLPANDAELSIGVDDLNAFISSQPYLDSKQRVRTPDGAYQNEKLSPYETSKDEEDSYAELSLSALTRLSAQAEVNGDRTTLNSVDDAIQAKLDAMDLSGAKAKEHGGLVNRAGQQARERENIFEHVMKLRERYVDEAKGVDTARGKVADATQDGNAASNKSAGKSSKEASQAIEAEAAVDAAEDRSHQAEKNPYEVATDQLEENSRILDRYAAMGKERDLTDKERKAVRHFMRKGYSLTDTIGRFDTVSQGTGQNEELITNSKTNYVRSASKKFEGIDLTTNYDRAVTNYSKLNIAAQGFENVDPDKIDPKDLDEIYQLFKDYTDLRPLLTDTELHDPLFRNAEPIQGLKEKVKAARKLQKERLATAAESKEPIIPVVGAKEHMDSMPNNELISSTINVGWAKHDVKGEDREYVSRGTDGVIHAAVFDGVGGYTGGADAADAAREVFHRYARSEDVHTRHTPIADIFDKTVQHLQENNVDGYSTALAARAIKKNGHYDLNVAGVGDSLGFALLPNGRLIQLNREESAAQDKLDQGKVPDLDDGRTITNSLGKKGYGGTKEAKSFMLPDGTLVLLTTDGITGDNESQRLKGFNSNEEAIKAILGDPNLTPKQKAEKFVELSGKEHDDKRAIVIALGGKQNVTQATPAPTTTSTTGSTTTTQGPSTTTGELPKIQPLAAARPNSAAQAERRRPTSRSGRIGLLLAGLIAGGAGVFGYNALNDDAKKDATELSTDGETGSTTTFGGSSATAGESGASEKSPEDIAFDAANPRVWNRMQAAINESGRTDISATNEIVKLAKSKGLTVIDLPGNSDRNIVILNPDGTDATDSIASELGFTTKADYLNYINSLPRS